MLRNSQLQLVPSADLVPGDVVELAGGASFLDWQGAHACVQPSCQCSWPFSLRCWSSSCLCMCLCCTRGLAVQAPSNGALTGLNRRMRCGAPAVIILGQGHPLPAAMHARVLTAVSERKGLECLGRTGAPQYVIAMSAHVCSQCLITLPH